jgi:hypothetical protein
MRTISDRRAFLACFSGLGLASALFPTVLWARIEEEKSSLITKEMLLSAASVAGQTFTDQQLDQMLKGVNQHLAEYAALHKIDLDNSVAPPSYFNPVVPGMKIDRTKRPFQMSARERVSRPQNLEDVAFWPVTKLAELVRSRQVRSVELTEMYISRIKRHNPKLLCVVTLTEDLAMRLAREADREIAAGNYRGPLHGIPWGVKDLAAVKGYPTTWGAAPFKDRIIDTDATVVTRLTQAGAVLIAKLATGPLDGFPGIIRRAWFGYGRGACRFLDRHGNRRIDR